jgi:hypothetical protein
VDLEHLGLTRSTRGSLRDCMHDLQHDQYSTCKHQFALHFYKLGMIYHTGWLPGNLLFERFASVWLSQLHLVSFWFVSEVQGCSCLLPCSISAFISSTCFGSSSLFKLYALHAIQSKRLPSGKNTIISIHAPYPVYKYKLYNFWLSAQVLMFFIRMDQPSAEHPSYLP